MNGDFTLAVHALVFLNHKGVTVSSEVLADNICTNPARVRKIMSKLKYSGLIETKEGRQDGGYTLCLDPKDITLNRVAQALDADFVSANWRSGSIEKECLISSGMGSIMDEIYSNLNDLCYQSLQNTSILDIDKKIFK